MIFSMPPFAQQMGGQPLEGYGNDKKGYGGAKGKGRQKRPQANSSKAAKRASFPVINQELVAAAQTGDLNQLVATIENYLPKMNLVNLTTALHRLAKLTAHDQGSQTLLHQHRVLGGIVAGVHAALARSEAGGATPQCQVLSNVPWALATLNWVDMPLLIKMAALAEKRVEEFKTFELSPLLWAYARLEAMHGESCRCAMELFRLAADRVRRSAGEFSFRCLVMIAWAFAQAGIHDRDVFMAMVPHMRASAHVAQHQELANTVWAFSTAHVHHEELFAEIAQRALQHLWDFKGQDFTNLICGFAAAGFYNDALYANAVRVAEYLDLEPQQLLRLTWGIAEVCRIHPPLRGVVQSLLPRCSTVLPGFDAQQLAQAAMTAASSAPTYNGAASASPPVEVSRFLEQLHPVLVEQLPKLSPQLLAYTCAAYVKGSTNEGRQAFLDRAVPIILWRLPTSSPSSQLLYLRCLPTESAQCKQLVQALFAQLAANVALLSSQELQQLARHCAASSKEWPTSATDVEAIQRGCQALSTNADVGLHIVLSTLDEVFEEMFSQAHSTVAAEKEASQKASDAGVRNGTEQMSSGSAMTAVQEPFRYTVKNTFVELESDDTRMFEDDECGIPLPPTLEIIPHTIPPEMLEEYRRNYQKFRAGKPTGAKGELSLIAEAPDDEERYMTEALDLAASRQEQQNAKQRSRQAGALGGAADATPQKGEALGSTMRCNSWLHAEAASNGSVTPSTPLTSVSSRLPPGLPPPLDCVPRFIDPEKLATFRMGYQQFRMGLGMGAKGEASRATALDDNGGPRSVDSFALPPPLSIIPQEIPAERLETYRQSYQRFRTGQAVGAKGEVSSLSFDSLQQEAASFGRSRPEEEQRQEYRSEARLEEEEQQEPAGETALPAQAWNVKTKNTFLEIDDQSEADPGADVKGISLTEPLDCVPRDISPSKLTAYRLDYQNFRAGKAVGAKGEVWTAASRANAED